MIWTNKTHSCATTYCTKLGKPCPMAMRMLNALSHSMNTARGVTEEAFEITGTSELEPGETGCDTGCAVRFVADHSRIRIYCGVPKNAPQPGLDRFTDAIFSASTTGFPAAPGQIHPCAVAQAQFQASPDDVTALGSTTVR